MKLYPMVGSRDRDTWYGHGRSKITNYLCRLFCGLWLFEYRVVEFFRTYVLGEWEWVIEN